MPPEESDKSVRIQKLIAESGVLSRRKAEEAIVAGRVSVNGRVVTELGTKVNPGTDKVAVDGKELTRAAVKTVLLFHKPRRVVTTKADPEGRKTVMEYLPPEFQHLKPVGRLDFDSEGLILFTDDGEFANQVMHPRYGVRKSYAVWVTGVPGKRVIETLLKNVTLDDGPGRFEKVHVQKRAENPEDFTLLEVEVSEGRNRFIRRMFDAVGHPVGRLKRTRIGELDLGTLQSGRWRVLKPDETKLVFSSSRRTLDVLRR